MSGPDETDSSQALQDLLADLNVSPPLSGRHPPQPASSAPSNPSRVASAAAAASTSRPAPSLHSPRPAAPLFPRRASSRTNPAEDPEASSSSQAASHAPLFNTPSRSIFSPGPATSSVATINASMSSPPPAASSRPLSTTASSVPNLARFTRTQRGDSPHFSTPTSSRSRSAAVEKDVDDPTGATGGSLGFDARRDTTTNTLSTLFTVPEPSTPTGGAMSYFRTNSGTFHNRILPSEAAPLADHLYSRGFLEGRHSDITLIAFGRKYRLHRLLLDRVPFFSSALSEPWSESTAKEIALYPEDIDPNITKTAFELALKRIYGYGSQDEEEREAIGLFATACWLDMADLLEASITSLLRQMAPDKLSSYIRFVTASYYGKAGERILNSAKAMLYREGWEMPVKCWDGISGDIVREIVGGDGFYIAGEWERFVLAKRVLNRRLKALAADAGLLDGNGRLTRCPGGSRYLEALRCDSAYRDNQPPTDGEGRSTLDSWVAIYANPDIATILALLRDGIHYIHLSFEQLQRIKTAKDVLGLELVSDRVVDHVLWKGIELRQKILNVRDTDLEIGLTHEVEEEPAEEGCKAEKDNALGYIQGISSKAAGKQTAIADAGDGEGSDNGDEMEPGSWDGNERPRRFWIPQTDATYPMGGIIDSLIPANTGSRQRFNHSSRLSSSLDPTDLQWASDFASAVDKHIPPVSTVPSPQVKYTHFPPFRFAAEFPNPRSLKEGKRVYSSTVFYAGSLWNVYVQRKETQKTSQLGIYLHRERHSELNDDLAGHSYVTDEINKYEQLLRRSPGTRILDSRLFSVDDEHSSGDQDSTLVAGSPSDPEPRRRPTTITNLLRSHTSAITKSSEGSLHNFPVQPDRHINNKSALATSPPETDRENDGISGPEIEDRAPRLPALSPFVDTRPTIRTYFKIYAPSKGGRVLSVYESAPDKFNFSQSWGWKSSNLILDDGVVGVCEEVTNGRGRDGKLRFMVVIGIV